MSKQCVLYLDKEAAQGALVRGSSETSYAARMLSCFTDLERRSCKSKLGLLECQLVATRLTNLAVVIFRKWSKVEPPQSRFFGKRSGIKCWRNRSLVQEGLTAGI